MVLRPTVMGWHLPLNSTRPSSRWLASLPLLTNGRTPLNTARNVVVPSNGRVLSLPSLLTRVRRLLRTLNGLVAPMWAVATSVRHLQGWNALCVNGRRLNVAILRTSRTSLGLSLCSLEVHLWMQVTLLVMLCVVNMKCVGELEGMNLFLNIRDALRRARADFLTVPEPQAHSMS